MNAIRHCDDAGPAAASGGERLARSIAATNAARPGSRRPAFADLPPEGRR